MGLIQIPKGDPFDPNNWILDDHECRIYADESLEIYAVVDWIDYIALCQYKWSIHSFRVRSNTVRRKFYLRRALAKIIAPEGEKYQSPTSGKIVRNQHRIQSNLFLHQAVMQRMGVPPPTPNHKMIDHKDRETMNCRRSNLEWATAKSNGNNRAQHGPWPAKS